MAPWGDDVIDFGGYLTQQPPLEKTLEAYFTFFGHFWSLFSICGQKSNELDKSQCKDVMFDLELSIWL